MDKLRCRLNVSSKKSAEHISQIITGFIMLKEQGLIDLKINRTKDHPFSGIVEVIVNDEINILYDMADGYLFDIENVQEYAKRADYYFKRSFNEDYHRHLDFAKRIYPLGFNYHVSTKNNILDIPLDVNNQIKWYVKGLLGKHNHQEIFVEKFEDIPRNDNLNPIILFTTRTWSMESIGLDKEETKYIDNMRAECIRKLKKEFKENFIGGFSHRDYAKKYYPDCLLDESITNKINFMRLVKQSDICISTMGLHRSNGWKLGEYIAASKAIVSEKLHYSVPGEFLPDQNYLEFTTSDGCLEQTVQLANDEELMYKIKNNNYNYYSNYLRPDKLILNSLNIVLENAII